MTSLSALSCSPCLAPSNKLQCPVTRMPLYQKEEIHLVDELQVASHARQRLLAAGGLPQEHGEVI